MRACVKDMVLLDAWLKMDLRRNGLEAVGGDDILQQKHLRRGRQYLHGSTQVEELQAWGATPCMDLLKAQMASSLCRMQLRTVGPGQRFLQQQDLCLGW